MREKHHLTLVPKLSRCLAGRTWDCRLFYRSWTRRSDRIHDFVAGKDWKSHQDHKLVTISLSGINSDPYKAGINLS